MKTFVWSQEFYTGLGLIDEQHHRLVDLFNRLADVLTNSEGADALLQEVFSDLMDYVREHFTTEEGLMRSQHVDPRHIEMHTRLHDQFSEQVRSMWKARALIGNPAEVFLSFLTSWLCAHVLGVDQSLARQIEAIRVGATPAEAYERELSRPQDKAAEAMVGALRNIYHVVSRLGMEVMTANRLLEARVAARTAELREANEALLRANRKLEVFAQTDGLLGIANRKYFDSRLNDEWHRAVREQEPLAVLMIDVDYFKNYNDRYGHLAGDACLQGIASAAAGRMIRAVDLLARYGGEEFVVLLPNTRLSGAQKVAQEICAAVAALGLPHDRSAVADVVTVSVGVAARVPDRVGDPVSLVAAADEALYMAKQQGRNRVCAAT